jgi:hypothetical protein
VFVLSDKDKVDFWTAADLHGYAEADFELTAYDDPPAREGSDRTGIIVVTHTRTFVRRIYPVGFGSRWIADFEHDLARHAFHAGQAKVRDAVRRRMGKDAPQPKAARSKSAPKARPSQTTH